MVAVGDCVSRGSRMMLAMDNVVAKMERVQRMRDRQLKSVAPGKEPETNDDVEFAVPTFSDAGECYFEG